MIYIVEYKMHNGKIPYFIADGGYFPSNGRYIGFTHDSYECYIPRFVADGGDLVEITEQDFEDRFILDYGQDPLDNTTIPEETKRQKAKDFIKDKKEKDK